MFGGHLLDSVIEYVSVPGTSAGNERTPLRVGMPKSVDRLVIVSDHKQRCRGRERQNQPLIRSVQVLEFVRQHLFKGGQDGQARICSGERKGQRHQLSD